MRRPALLLVLFSAGILGAGAPASAIECSDALPVVDLTSRTTFAVSAPCDPSARVSFDLAGTLREYTAAGKQVKRHQAQLGKRPMRVTDNVTFEGTVKADDGTSVAVHEILKFDENSFVRQPDDTYSVRWDGALVMEGWQLADQSSRLQIKLLHATASPGVTFDTDSLLIDPYSNVALIDGEASFVDRTLTIGRDRATGGQTLDVSTGKSFSDFPFDPTVAPLDWVWG